MTENVCSDYFSCFGQDSSIFRKIPLFLSFPQHTLHCLVECGDGVSAVILFFSFWKVFQQSFLQPCFIESLGDIKILKTIDVEGVNL